LLLQFDTHSPDHDEVVRLIDSQFVDFEKICRCDTYFGSYRSASEVRWLTVGSPTLFIRKALG
jgi:hypothetical protein